MFSYGKEPTDDPMERAKMSWNDQYPQTEMGSEEESTQDETPVVEVAEAGEVEASESPAAGTRTRTTASKVTKAQARRIVTKVHEVFGLNTDELALAASVFGCAANTEDVSLTMSTLSDIPEGLAILVQVAPMDAIEATANIAGLSRPGVRAAWSLARKLGADIPRKCPGGMVATIELSKAATSLDETARRNLATLASLVS